MQKKLNFFNVNPLLYTFDQYFIIPQEKLVLQNEIKGKQPISIFPKLFVFLSTWG